MRFAALWAVFVTSAACLLGAPSGCDHAPTPEAEPTPGTARTPRLAVLSPALAQTIRDLQRESTIVARHGWDSFTPPAIPAAGSESGIEYEILLRARPTHVLLQTGAKELPPRLVELATQGGWSIETVPALSLDDVRSSIIRLAELCAAEPGHAKRLEDKFDKAFVLRTDFELKAGRVLILAGTDPPGVMGPGSFHFELVRRLGGTPVPDQGAAYMQLSLEDVARLDPDSLVLLLPGYTSDTNPPWRDALGPLDKLSLRCVAQGRVVLITDDRCQLPASSLADTANEVAAQVGAWAARPTGTPNP